MNCKSCKQKNFWLSRKCKHCGEKIDNESKIILVVAGLLILGVLVFAIFSEQKDLNSTALDSKNPTVLNTESSKVLNKSVIPISAITENNSENIGIDNKNLSVTPVETLNVTNQSTKIEINQTNLTANKTLDNYSPKYIYENIALYKSVTGTCPSIPVPGWPIVTDFNRITNGIWFTEPKYPPPLDDPRYEYLEVRECGVDRCVIIDLEKIYLIDKIVIHNGFPAPGYEDVYIKSNIVQISTDNTVWKTVYTNSKDANRGAKDILLRSNPPARYIKQCMDGNNYQSYQAGWTQIEVWSNHTSKQ